MHSLKGIIAIVLIASAGFFALSPFAYANTIVSQTIKSSTETVSGNFHQDLPTGTSGTLGGIILNLGTSSGIGTSTIQVFDCGTTLPVSKGGTSCNYQNGSTYLGYWVFTNSDGSEVSNTLSTTLTDKTFDFSYARFYHLTYDATSTITLDPTHYYSFTVATNPFVTTLKSGGSSSDNLSDSKCTKSVSGTDSNCSTLADLYFNLYDGLGNTSDTSTRIVTVTPADNATIATSTSATIGSTGYISSDDFNNSSDYVRQELIINTVPAIGCYGLSCQTDRLLHTFNYPISTSGTYSVSTTTSLLTEDTYTLKTYLIKPTYTILGIDIGENKYLATTTSFIVSTSTQANLYNQTYIKSLDQLFNQVGQYCNVLSGFDPVKCLQALFIPTSNDIANIYQVLHDGVLQVAPWGYAQRIIDIFTTQATDELPTIKASLPSEIAFGTTRELDLTPWSGLMGTSSLLYTATSYGDNPETFRDITENAWNKFVVFCLFIALFLRYTGHSTIGGILESDDARAGREYREKLRQDS